jgi:cytochrome c-type biogenesis protein CcmH/NrfG
MTALRQPAPIPTEDEVLRQLGLDRRATPEEVAKRHDELVAFLASAPRSLWPWARAQAELADDAFATLSDPSALRRPEALSDRAPRTAPQPGGPATPPARQATLVAAGADDETGADDLEGESFEELLAAVTPTTHRDSAPVRGSAVTSAGRAPAAPAASRRSGVGTSADSALLSPDRGGSVALRRLAIGVAGVAVLAAIVYGGFQMGNAPAAATVTPTASAAATPALDQAKVAALMAKIQANPNDKQALLDLGDAFFKAGDYATSATWLEKAVALDGSNVTARLALGAARFNLGDSDAAKAQWNEALKLDANNVEAHYDLGFLYFNADPQDLAGVQREWGEVIALAPGTDVARVVKAHLDALKSQAPTTSGAPSSAPSGAATSVPAGPSAAPSGSAVP